jgi:outer membrane biosynthesis protein TonB
MSGSFYRRTSILSTVAHGLIILVLVLSALVQGCRYKRKKIELMEFTVAVNTAEEAEEPVLPKPDEPAPPKPRDPEPPPPLPPEPDRIPEPKPPDKKPPERKPEEKKPLEKKPPDKKPPDKKPIQKGTRVVRGPKAPPVRQTLSDEEIAKWLRQRVRIGDKDVLPDSEQALNFALVRDALYDAWDQPVRSEAGSRPAEAAFSLDNSGRLSAPRIIQSSGSPVFDASVLEAIRRVGRIDGLSARFLRSFPRLSVEFKLSE